jgi:cytochrome P450
MAVIGRWYKEYGDTLMVQFGKQQQYLTSRPEYLHEVLVTQASKFHKDNDYKNPKVGLARFLGNGILTSDGEFWKRQRKLVAPALHARRIASYADVIVDYSAQMLDRWHSGVRMDISREMLGVTMKIIAEILFHLDVSEDVQRVEDAVHVMQKFSSTRHLLPTWIPTPLELRSRRAIRDLDDVIYRIIAQRGESGEDKGDLLGMLSAARDDEDKPMSDKQMRDELVTLFIAGHETTANTLNWAFYLLAQNPDVERKLHEELDTVLAGQLPTFADLMQLPYLDMVVKEVMRLYPAAWGVSREAIEDVQLGPYFMPKGSTIGLTLYFTHHDPQNFPDPERFDPERFSAENEKNIPDYAYLPFGGGPRVCVGNSLAMMETRLIVATIASRFRLSLAPGQTVQMDPLITLNTKGGMAMTVTARERMQPSAEVAALDVEGAY